MDDYGMLYPQALAYDLNQNPWQRPKKSGPILSTLTTGCSKIWLHHKKRYMLGIECLTMHSIPVISEVAHAMRCRQINITGLSHSAQCFLAGNSMHGASVGAMLALGVLYTRPT